MSGLARPITLAWDGTAPYAVLFPSSVHNDLLVEFYTTGATAFKSWEASIVVGDSLLKGVGRPDLGRTV